MDKFTMKDLLSTYFLLQTIKKLKQENTQLTAEANYWRARTIRSESHGKTAGEAIRSRYTV